MHGALFPSGMEEILVLYFTKPIVWDCMMISLRMSAYVIVIVPLSPRLHGLNRKGNSWNMCFVGALQRSRWNLINLWLFILLERVDIAYSLHLDLWLCSKYCKCLAGWFCKQETSRCLIYQKETNHCDHNTFVLVVVLLTKIYALCLLHLMSVMNFWNTCIFHKLIPHPWDHPV